MPQASIDLGSNSVLLLVLGDDGSVLHDEARVTGLGSGLGDRGLFTAERMDATMELLCEYAARAQVFGVLPAHVRVAATSAFRRALNAASFSRRIKDKCRLHVRVISGEEEARLTARGALTGLALPTGPILVIDPGGGSTELILVESGRRAGSAPLILYRHSLEVGAVRLTDTYLGTGVVSPRDLHAARSAVGRLLSAISPEPWPRAVVTVGGTATSLVTAQLALDSYDAHQVHGALLELSALRGWMDRLRSSDLAQRRALLPATPERAETLLAGTLILSQVLQWCHRPNMLVSHRGLRFGLLVEP